MKKLLLVEDSNLFAKAIQRQLAQNNCYEVFHAATYEQALELLEQHCFFVAITDLVLPDASQGEIVRTVVGKAIPTIPLTSSMNEVMQQQISALPIVDYVVKSGISDLFYAVRLAELLLTTDNMPVLIVDDSMSSLSSIGALMQPLLFNIYTAKSGAEALKVLQEHPEISLMVTDYEMPEMNGQELVREVRKKRDALEFPIIAVTGHRDPQLGASFLKTGVNDFLVKPFSREEFISRIVTLVNSREKFKQIDRYAATVDNYVITSSTDENGIIRSVSQAFCDISGYSREELIGRNHNIVRHPDMPDSLYKDLWDTIQSGCVWRGEVKNAKKNGDFYWVDVTIEPQKDRQGDITGYTAIRQDITNKKHIETLSVTDPMTGLYNRRHLSSLFPDYAAKAIEQGALLAFLIFDVDKFKQYNDNYGHQAGDDVLINIGTIMQDVARRHDALAYRLGGEEFALLYLSGETEQALSCAEDMRYSIESLGILHEYNSAASVVTASFGLFLSTGSSDLEQCYQRSDEALYQAKESGRNRTITFSE
ncbi:diguanylate cyclase [Oceanospirillum sediminis]|uniref:Diguanylate cyclase n=1 Tax=Oceanospirillum sediminis TaxID=2760088 RepID=A0A839IVQ0_9GAMM|nr:diguanylate cyclase [Oceanospirillum sediminis]MBB1489028.1 diguanylate cyclase [Oceanospirillum sediminis]